MADSTPKSYHTDPTLWLYTSLTSGSSQIISATSRLEGILKANRIPFQALDVATDEKARMLWGRRAGKRKLPGLVRMGMVVGDFAEVDEWNEFGEVRQNIGPLEEAAPSTPTPSTSKSLSNDPIATTSSSSSSAQPSSTSTSISTATSTPPRAPPASSLTENPLTLAMRQAGQEAAKKASSGSTKPTSSTSTSSALKKLDNSTPTGIPPPTGTTDETSAIAPETGSSTATSKVDDVAPAPAPTPDAAAERAAISTTEGYGSLDRRSGGKESLPTAQPEVTGEYTQHRGSSISSASPEVVKALEQENMIKEEPAEESVIEDVEVSAGKEGGVRTRDATATGNEATGLQGGGLTQEQKAASPAGVTESVAD